MGKAITGSNRGKNALRVQEDDGTNVQDGVIELQFEGDDFVVSRVDSGVAKVDLAAAGGGNTLDQAYDQGGAGSGRSITADSGAVSITVTDTSNNAALTLTQNDTTNNPQTLAITNTGTGDTITATNALGEVFTVASGEVVVNEAQVLMDFRVESNHQANALKVDSDSTAASEKVSLAIPLVLPNAASTSTFTGTNGMLIYSTADNSIMGYSNGSWVDLTRELPAEFISGLGQECSSDDTITIFGGTARSDADDANLTYSETNIQWRQQAITNEPISPGSSVTVNIADTTGFVAGQFAFLDNGGGTNEMCLIEGVAANVSVTLQTVVNTYNDPSTITSNADFLTSTTSAWAYIWLVGDGVTDDVVLSSSSSSPTVPAGGWASKRLIGAAYVDSSGDFIYFNALGSNMLNVMYAGGVVFSSSDLRTLAGGTATSFTAFNPRVPPIVNSKGAHFHFDMGADGDTWQLSTDGTNASYQIQNNTRTEISNVALDSSQQLYYKRTGGSSSFNASTLGFSMMR